MTRDTRMILGDVLALFDRADTITYADGHAYEVPGELADDVLAEIVAALKLRFVPAVVARRPAAPPAPDAVPSPAPARGI